MSEMQVVGGVYALDTIEEQLKYANFLISKKLVSDTFRDPTQLMVAIQLCKDLKLPNSCLKDFYVIGGKPAIYGDTFVALALGSGVIEEYSIDFYDEDGELCNIPKKGKKVFSCVITGRRKGSSKDSQISYSLDDKTTSRNTNPNFEKHPRDMLFRRSMGRFIKWICADAIRGIEMVDYAEESIPAIRNETPAGQLLCAVRDSLDIDHPIPLEEKTVGPLYRFQNSVYRGKQLYQLTTDELQEYLDKLNKRTTPKKQWEVELQLVLMSYLQNIDSWREMILELQNGEE